jgi:hypothetical protein
MPAATSRRPLVCPYVPLQGLTGDPQQPFAGGLCQDGHAFTNLLHFDTMIVVATSASTPVTAIWSDILMLPIVGTIDSKRAKDVTPAILRRIGESRSKILIMDISGVAVIDTQVAYAGVGNTSACVFGRTARPLVSRPGTLGATRTRPFLMREQLAAGEQLVMVTDGIRAPFRSSPAREPSPRRSGSPDRDERLNAPCMGRPKPTSRILMGPQPTLPP